MAFSPHEALARCALFADAPEAFRAACASRLREARFGRGELLFSRGDPGDRLYVVAEGQIRLAIGASDGRALSFEIVGPGDLFGEIALLDGGPRSAEASALTAASAFSLARADFFAALAAHPEAAAPAIAYLCRRIREISDKLEALALYPLDVRLARYLVAALGEGAQAPGRREPLELGFSQGELAQLIGASRQKINLALSALEKAGALRRTSDRLFCDRARLAEIARRET